MNTYLILAIFIVLCIITGCVNNLKNNVIENLELEKRKLKMTPEGIKEYVNDTVTNALAEFSVEQGVQGPPGPRGYAGPAGGVFLNNGRIQNAGNLNLKLSLSDDNSPIIVKDVNITPDQRWVLNSNNKLKAIWLENQCLSLDENDAFETVNCENAKMWRYDDKLLQLRVPDMKGEDKCLTLGTDNGNQIVNLEKCTSGTGTDTNQSWIFS